MSSSNVNPSMSTQASRPLVPANFSPAAQTAITTWNRQHATQYMLEVPAAEYEASVSIRHVGLRDNESLLSLGCGVGLELMEARRVTSGRVFGVDVSPDMITEARRRIGVSGLKNIAVLRDDIATLSAIHDALIARGRFDVIIAHAVLFELKENDRTRALELWASLLNPGGRILIDWSMLGMSCETVFLCVYRENDRSDQHIARELVICPDGLAARNEQQGRDFFARVSSLAVGSATRAASLSPYSGTPVQTMGAWAAAHGWLAGRADQFELGPLGVDRYLQLLRSRGLREMEEMLVHLFIEERMANGLWRHGDKYAVVTRNVKTVFILTKA